MAPRIPRAFPLLAPEDSVLYALSWIIEQVGGKATLHGYTNVDYLISAVREGTPFGRGLVERYGNGNGKR